MMDKSILKRHGKFRITTQLLRENPEAVQKVFAKCIPVRAELMLQGYVEYNAFSQYFDEIGDECEAPLYAVEITTAYNDNHKPFDYGISFVRAKLG